MTPQLGLAPQPGDAEELLILMAHIKSARATGADDWHRVPLRAAEMLVAEIDRLRATVADLQERVAAALAERDAAQAKIRDWEYTVKWMRPRMDKAEYELERLRAGDDVRRF